MPAGKEKRNNTALYTLITFVGLFIIAAVFAIIYYVKAEGYRRKADTAQARLGELATSAELRKIGAIIGAKQGRKSRLGTLVDYLDETVSLIVPGLEDSSAEVKVDAVNRKVEDTLELLAQKHPDIEGLEAKAGGLIRIIENLKTKLDNTTKAELAAREQLKELQNRFDDATAAGFEKEQTLLAEKERYQQQVEDVRKGYNELKALMEQGGGQQVRILSAQLDEERANRKKLNQKLLKAQAELKLAEDRVRDAQQELMKIKPLPDTEALAFKPDGKIILIDHQAKVVYLDIGSSDHVYRGLTFSVYDKNMPIPKDGRAKAEIEVFNVGKNISAARITRSERTRPIILDDIVANLIWDADRTNVFVVAGEFDLDNDGNIDYDAVDKIKALIEEWGGVVAETVSIDTDFLVLGRAPQVRRKPSFEEMEVDPTAMEKYELSLQNFERYRQVQSQAQVLSIPVFNAERFLLFIGHKPQF